MEQVPQGGLKEGPGVGGLLPRLRAGPGLSGPRRGGEGGPGKSALLLGVCLQAGCWEALGKG